MKTIKSNNYSQAIKEVGELDKAQLKRVNEEIKHAERVYYHLLGVKVETMPGEAKNKVIVNPMILNPDKFEKLKKNNKFLGFSKIIVVHDPSQLSEEELNQTPTMHVHDKEKLEREIEARLKEKHEKEKEELRKELEEKYMNGNSSDNAGGGDGSDGGGEPTELETDYQTAMSGNKDELVAFLEKYQIPQDELSNNDLRKKAITDYFNAEMEKLEGGTGGGDE